MEALTQAKAYPTQPIVNKGELPDPFAVPGGARVDTRAAWPARAQTWKDTILETEYGGLPPPPQGIEVETLCHAEMWGWPDAPHLWSYRVHCLGGKRPLAFSVRVLFPRTKGPFPAVITGDGCWWYLSEEVARRVVSNGYALVMFNRTELAEDLGYFGVPDKTRRSGGLYDVYPGGDFGALSAWAWGYHRCVDLLHTLPFIDRARVAVTGHSRGGKTVLIAGMTDERITLINDNASCAGGSATFRYVGDGGETIGIANAFPSWFGPRLPRYVGCEETLPFDQHCLLAAIAPRPLLLTYALDDRWSNPEGMVQCAWAAGEVYRFLGVPENLAFHLRQGDHAHAPADWDVLLDFMAWKWNGTPPKAPYNAHPYKHLQAAFSWTAPKL